MTMKKIFYDNGLAKLILFEGYTVITLFCFVFCRLPEYMVKQFVVNHECVHARQWSEITVASGLLVWVAVLLGLSPWWLLPCTLVFYLLYGLEFLVRFLIAMFSDCHGDTVWHTAYLSISFEQEARMAEHDNNYLENSPYFAWVKFIKRKTIQE